MENFLFQFLNVEIAKTVLPQLLIGLKTTLILSFIVVPLGVLGGIVISVLQDLRIRPLNMLLVTYIDFFRAFPPLVLLIFIYYGLPFLGFETSSMQAVVLALVFNTSAYFAEVVRAGIESVPRGQVEAARATGLGTAQTMRWVVLPQAVRNVLPDLMSNVLESIKLTSIASVVTMPELLRMARVAQGNMFNTTPLILAALMYLALLWPLVRLITTIERRSLKARG
ncbi:amino acid ABC transporter permease [Alloyangia pacifica]|uniref:Polar amino acid transport system permease protein n=1 Tax=Alloyangia pacifica TaxID=311180 RepID=A0A1I6VIE2_9RHOB|nr:amino acid ABC transporter permease [Alloyangia pacifica]SDH98546.1 polar amino acid transport system permease protein [Alloyangia pacifica]SFT13204.1 polar amino acid transport system permease protein [Alloyangia pacifica]